MNIDIEFLTSESLWENNSFRWTETKAEKSGRIFICVSKIGMVEGNFLWLGLPSKH